MEKRKGTIVCDSCGGEIGQIEGLREQEIAQDEDGNDITEMYFECPRCGKHYTVMVIDRKVRLMIQRRKQLLRRIYRTMDETAQEKLTAEERALHEDIKARSDALREKHLGGGAI